jgi:hypothetical protein
MVCKFTRGEGEEGAMLAAGCPDRRQSSSIYNFEVQQQREVFDELATTAAAAADGRKQDFAEQEEDDG